MSYSPQVYRNRGPEAIAVYGADVSVYQPGDIISHETVEAHTNPALAWTALAGYINRRLIKLEALELPAHVQADEVDDILSSVLAAAEERAKSTRRPRRANGEGASPDADKSARENTLFKDDETFNEEA